ncbi:MAG TPA: hypothetical protein VM142_13520 [Acidimicrobiales bacterium]|nr:hypothetical protein [Acidimicrobiales bacterium]
MAAPIPKRDRKVFFVGAGLSCALGLPNTPSLIDEVEKFARRPEIGWLDHAVLAKSLGDAFKFFYPDGQIDGYRPDVVDFFSSLRTFIEVGAGMPGTGFGNPRELQRTLPAAMAHLLIDRCRASNDTLEKGHSYLDKIVQPGNIAITSNWDLLPERYAAIRNVPLALTGLPSDEFGLLKLQGSVDWCLVENRKPGRSDAEYASLAERLNRNRRYRTKLPTLDGDVLRIRALEGWNKAWQKIRSRGTDHLMVTMAPGKQGEIVPLDGVWRDAYGAVSRASLLEIVGSMPGDDVEIRTLLRAGIRRQSKGGLKISVVNPAPDVHDRVRRYLQRSITSSYVPIGGA